MSENAPDPRRRLSTAEIDAAGLTDWRLLAGRLQARFAPADYAAGLDLVARIGAAAEDADHHPETTLTYGHVVLTLSSHDVGGVTSRDVRMARRISALAAELGAGADVAGLTRAEFGLDTDRGDEHARYYAALLGAEVTAGGEVTDPALQAPTLWWQGSAGEGSASETPLPAPEVEQRWHLDVWVAPEEAPARLRAVLDAGGRLVSDAAAPSFWVVEDVEGNRSCICTSQDRA
ncbi:4a-hydroxytetrahydrobiopterin dehydratase [Micrococcus endophyticus]|uniref:4a-hydroxytetrahydrobiopterin dehydratase n=1 Tax=Micrococcus endophyticus TaxID=455343 RepID=UPI0010C816C7|nr:4a-hydroxytetrahydrobiopterin dehydratase [Micrococcus luteus]